MTALARFPLTPDSAQRGRVLRVAYVPAVLVHKAGPVAVSGRLDPAAVYSVLPHSTGLQLGAVWGGQTSPIPVPGRRTPIQAEPLMVYGTVAPFPAVPLVFAWASTNGVSVIWGQSNFLDVFDVCFHLARGHVELTPSVRGGH